MSRKRERRRISDLAPKPQLWAWLQNGALLRPILEEFYDRVYASDDLGPFFARVTKEHAIGKQHAFLLSIMTGERVYFGQRMRNAHHWMVIDEGLFYRREALFAEVLRSFEFPPEGIEEWLRMHEVFRKQIVKTAPIPKKIGGIAMPLEGYEPLILEVGSLCDGCQAVLEAGTRIEYHVRTGSVHCALCAPSLGANS